MIIFNYLIILSGILLLSSFNSCCCIENSNEHNQENVETADSSDNNKLLAKKIHQAKLELWSRGSFGPFNNNAWDDIERRLKFASFRLGPQKTIRRNVLNDLEIEFDDGSVNLNPRNHLWNQILSMRAGASAGINLEVKLQELGEKYGKDFVEAIEQNKREHLDDCKISCELFYCANETSSGKSSSKMSSTSASNTTFTSYSFGATPPEDFAEEFGFPLDLIKVSTGQPLFTPEDAKHVIKMAEGEGIDGKEYQSGKYKLGGDWLSNLPNTRQWFNEKLKTTFFPLLTQLFPEIISSPSVLRAHSVSLLKYNTSHPRTDVHIDNGILAMTLAMTPSNEYNGGGTFFEHMGVDNVLPMDVGHGTFRPGSVRHGGHKVTAGTRYILGAFLLITDHVEHVRRLKNRGSEYRKQGELDLAEKHFQWALSINPKCTTCLKDWSEILYTKKKFAEAEEKIRLVLKYLEDRDSDALFTLGQVLSEQGRGDESIEAYRRSIELNSDDAELCYNLGIQLGKKSDVKGEMAMYAKATTIDPKFGGAWINWGTSLAEQGNMDDAEIMFLKGLECPEVKVKAMMNLALVYQSKANTLAQQGDLQGAKKSIMKASMHLDDVKPMLTLESSTSNGDSDDIRRYASQHEPLRIQCHRLTGSILAGLKDFAGCENEFKLALKNFPEVPAVWEMLIRVLDVQGKTTEAQQLRVKMNESFSSK